MGGMLDLEQQVGFYAQYHHNSVNKWIHIVCIPQLLWTGLVFMAYTGAFVSVPVGAGLPAVPVNGALVVAIVYALFYAALEPRAGVLYWPVLAVMVVSADLLVARVPNALAITLVWHAAAWIAQFIGHGIFERRAPALLDSLVQALLLAPLFAWLEVLFLFGYRPDLQRTIHDNAARDIAAYRRSSTSKTNQPPAAAANKKIH